LSFDNLKVAQFIYLLLSNENIRAVDRRRRRIRRFDDDGGDWVPILTAESTEADPEAAIETWTAWALDEFGATLAADPDLTDAQRAALVAYVAPESARLTRAGLEAALARLRKLHVH
jgi:hypothetical protein